MFRYHSIADVCNKYFEKWKRNLWSQRWACNQS